MADYDELFAYGESGAYINTVTEIPKGSSLKIEYDREKKVFVLDRVEPAIFAKPVNYGFIPGTLDEDGDALDTLLVTDEPVPPAVVVRARIIGIMNFVDGGENDHKIICVPEDDRQTGDAIQSLADLGPQWRKQVEHHFSHYKDLKKPGSTLVEGWGDAAAAWQVVEACASAYSNRS